MPCRPLGGQGLSVPPTPGPHNLRCDVPEGSGDHPTPALRTAGGCANNCTVMQPPPQGPSASRTGLRLGTGSLLKEEMDAGSDGGGEAPMVCGGDQSHRPVFSGGPPSTCPPNSWAKRGHSRSGHHTQGFFRVFSLLGQQPQGLASTAFPERSLSPAVLSVPSSKPAPLSPSLGWLVSQASSHFPVGTGSPQPVHASPSV